MPVRQLYRILVSVWCRCRSKPYTSLSLSTSIHIHRKSITSFVWFHFCSKRWTWTYRWNAGRDMVHQYLSRFQQRAKRPGPGLGLGSWSLSPSFPYIHYSHTPCFFSNSFTFFFLSFSKRINVIYCMIVQDPHGGGGGLAKQKWKELSPVDHWIYTSKQFSIWLMLVCIIIMIISFYQTDRYLAISLFIFFSISASFFCKSAYMYPYVERMLKRTIIMEHPVQTGFLLRA